MINSNMPSLSDLSPIAASAKLDKPLLCSPFAGTTCHLLDNLILEFGSFSIALTHTCHFRVVAGCSRSPLCSICSMGLPETSYHFVIECTALK